MLDILLEVVGAILTTFIFYTIFSGTRYAYIREQPGVNYVVIGFGLLLFSSVLDITDNFPALNDYLIIGDTELQAFLEKAVGRTLGLLFLFRGVSLWIPSLQELVNARQSLNTLALELDARVQSRSLELEHSNQNLKHEIIERKRIEQQLKHQLMHDNLTGIPNRFALIEFLEQELKGLEKHKHVSAILFLDLDNFKQINDLYGHGVGDSVLKIVANRLNQLCQSELQFIGRLAGDEFVIVMSQLNSDSVEATKIANQKAHQILTVLSEPMSVLDQQLKISASIGIKLFCHSKKETVYDLLRQADTAMYHIKEKEKKKGGFSIFHEEMQNVVRDRAIMVRELNQALEHKQLYLQYQPQVTSDGEVSGVEALLRWNHPEGKVIRPDTFIPVAEESGLIDKIGRYVLHLALDECSRLMVGSNRENRLKIAVNISPSHFLQSDFVNQVEEIMQMYALDNCQLVLEITESVVIQDIDDISEKMDLLHKLGVAISLDDFGTGYSSLSYINKLPFDTLKIDRSFIKDVNINANDAAIVEAILAMTSSLGVGVIAEGVETDEQIQFLQQRGCKRYQGFKFARPSALDEIKAFVLNHSDEGILTV